MENNLFISYEINSSNKNDNKIVEEIKKLGAWASIQKFMWFAKSSLSSEEVANKVYSHMTEGDTLIVINTTTNDAYWYNLSDEVAQHMQNYWHQ